MNSDIKYLDLCGRLMTGRGFDCNFMDAIEADNILYRDFGMSSEDILENFSQNTQTSMCK
jgi:hypothetical protein